MLDSFLADNKTSGKWFWRIFIFYNNLDHGSLVGNKLRLFKTNNLRERFLKLILLRCYSIRMAYKPSIKRSWDRTMLDLWASLGIRQEWKFTFPQNALCSYSTSERIKKIVCRIKTLFAKFSAIWMLYICEMGPKTKKGETKKKNCGRTVGCWHLFLNFSWTITRSRQKLLGTRFSVSLKTDG